MIDPENADAGSGTVHVATIAEVTFGSWLNGVDVDDHRRNFPQVGSCDLGIDPFHSEITWTIGSPELDVVMVDLDDQFRIGNVVTEHGRWMAFDYDDDDRITQLRDNSGRTVTYTYDLAGRLVSVTDAAGGVTTYSYDGSNRMTSITDPTSVTFLVNEYDTEGRVETQTLPNGGTYQFTYTLRGDGTVEQADVVNPEGHLRRVTISESGRAVTDTQAVGTLSEATRLRWGRVHGVVSLLMLHPAVVPWCGRSAHGPHRERWMRTKPEDATIALHVPGSHWVPGGSQRPNGPMSRGALLVFSLRVGSCVCWGTVRMQVLAAPR